MPDRSSLPLIPPQLHHSQFSLPDAFVAPGPLLPLPADLESGVFRHVRASVVDDDDLPPLEVLSNSSERLLSSTIRVGEPRVQLFEHGREAKSLVVGRDDDRQGEGGRRGGE